MNRFAPKRSAPVDRPTVMLTEAERREFRRMADALGWRRRVLRFRARVPMVTDRRVSAFAWLAGATWIVWWFTSDLLLSALGFVPFMVGMGRVLWAPATGRRVRAALHRLSVGLRTGGR